MSEPYDRQEETDWEGLQQAAQQTLNEEAAAFRAQQALEEEPPPLDPAVVLAEECRGWLQATMELRARVPNPPPTAPHTVVHDALTTARAVQDRIETLLSLAIGFKNACEAKARMLENAADDAWDDQAKQEKRYGRREYEGAQERYAYWRLACRTQRKDARDARELADIASDVERRVRLHYYGLDGARDDLGRRLAVLRMENSMER
jgi:hypothetical protein